MSLLLHDSDKYKNYPFKRNNINNIIYKYNENNELRLTLKKSNDLNSIDSNENKFDIRQLYNSYNNDNFNFEQYRSDIFLTPKQNRIINLNEDDKRENNYIFKSNEHKVFKPLQISENIMKILYNSDDEISLDEQKIIYNKFKNKFPYFRNKLNNQLKFPPFNSEKPYKYKNLEKKILSPLKVQNLRLSKSINKSEFDQLLKTVNKLRTLRDKVKINKNILSEENILKEIKKESAEVTPKNDFPKKKFILNSYDMFYYNAKKWKQNGIRIKNRKDKIHFKEINMQINETIKQMKNKVISLNQELSKLEDVRNKMKSQNKLIAIKSKSFRDFKSYFFSHEEPRKKYIKQASKIIV